MLLYIKYVSPTFFCAALKPRYRPRSAEYEAVSLARLADGRRVHDGCHFLNVLCENAVEEPRVAVLQRHHVDVFVQVVLVATEVVEHSLDLLVLIGDTRRQQSMDAEDLTLLQRKCRALPPTNKQVKLAHTR